MNLTAEQRETLSRRLKVLRKERGLSQEAVSYVVNIAAPALSQYETGKYLPGYAVLQGLADYFDSSPDYLLGLSSQPCLNESQPVAITVDGKRSYFCTL